MLQTRNPFTSGGWSMFVAGALLTIISILLVYSANHNSPDPRLQDDWGKQIIWFVLAAIVFFATTAMPLRMHEVFAPIYYGIAIILLLGLILFGASMFGAQRWYSLGAFSIQPAEIGKVAFIFMLARYLTYSRRPISSLKKIAAASAICGVITLLVVRQPDLGSAVIFAVVFLVMMFWEGMPVKYLLLFITPVASMIASSSMIAWIVFFALLIFAVVPLIRSSLAFTITLVAINLAVGAFSSIAWNRLHDYQQMRIKIFLDPGQDPLGAGYQIIQSKVAIGSGGLLGKGYLAGSQNKLDFLPLRHTDFIFSVAAEEFGMLGGVVIIALFGYIFHRGIRAAMKSRNSFSALVAIGATSALAFQMLVNIGMVLGLLPVAGVPLPFVSYGGSSLLVSWVFLGLVVNAERNWQEYS
ncbi:MAG: rod shape-determining protein RodA [candidate division Zixibacteria bacterium]|nr:rod shape-determining protein RodA [candidate division Zixibacteria bacterium]